VRLPYARIVESVLWYVIPLAMALALSVLPILAAVLILLSPNPVPVGVGYLSGWALGVLVLVSVFTLGARVVPSVGPERMPGWAHGVELVIGILLVVYAVISQVRSRTKDAVAPSWTRALSSLSPRRALLFGVAMNVRPKNLTLAVAAGLAIGSAALNPVASGLAIVVFTVVGISTVAGLVLSFLFGDKRVRPALERFSVWLQRHSGLVLRVSLLAIGLLLIGIGTTNLVSA
jgi:hypothetical protein